MAEIDRVVNVDIARDGGDGQGTLEQEMVKLRSDLISTDPSRGAGMVGYSSSSGYPMNTVGSTLSSLEGSILGIESKADSSLEKSNEALSRAANAEANAGNALLKQNNLSDLSNKIAALENLGALPIADVAISPSADKVPRAGTDGTIDINWIKDLAYNIAYLKKAVDDLKYPDGIFPYAEYDFTTRVIPPGFTFTRSSTATYFDKDGIMRTAAMNEPVFEYDPATGEFLGLRKEPSSTNIFAQSNYNSEYWNGGNSTRNIIENYGNAPDGTKTSSFLTTTSTDTPDSPYTARRSLPWKNDTVYCASVFLKINPSLPNRLVRLMFHSEITGSNKFVYFDVVTGAISVHDDPTFTPQQYGSQYCGNGWYRVWISDKTITEITNGVGWGPLIWFGGGSSVGIVAGEGIEFWGMQVEEGNYPTSLIETRGSAVTRVVDYIQLSTEKVFRGQEATIVADFQLARTAFTPMGRGFGIVTGKASSSVNYVGIGYMTDTLPSSSAMVYVVEGTGTVLGTTDENAITDGIQKYAVALKTGEPVRTSVNGRPVLTGEGNLGTNILNLSNHITIGSGTTGSHNTQWLGYAKSIQLFNRALPSDKLVEYSTR